MGDIKVSATIKAYHFIALVPNVEVRKVEEKSFPAKDGKTEIKSITLHCDDENGDRIYFNDKYARKDIYRRGLIGTFKIRLDCVEDFGTQSKITVVDFIPNETEEEEPKPTKGKAKK